MTQEKNATRNQKEKAQGTAAAKGYEKKGIAWPGAETRAGAAVKMHQRGAMKISATRKIPSGPIGGNGRKTNLARSS